MLNGGDATPDLKWQGGPPETMGAPPGDIRNELENDLHPGIPHETREVTRGIVLEAATRRIGCLVLDLRQLQRQGIHEGRMATAVLDEHRVIGHRRIQITPVDGARSFAVVVQKSEHPFSGWSLQRALVQNSLYFFDGVGVAGYFAQMLYA